MTELSRFRTVFTGVAGTPWYSNMYFEGGTPEGAAYGPFVQTFWEGCASQMHATVDWIVETDYAVIDSTTALITDLGSWAGDSGSGTGSGEALPWATQAIINWHTNSYLSGRELRGKTFVPALIQTANDGGVLLGSAQTDILNAANALIDDANGAFVVFSRTHFAEEIIESAEVPTKLGVLRSRRD